MSRLPKGYVPPDLVPVSRAGLSRSRSIRLIAIADLKALAKAGRKAGVPCIRALAASVMADGQRLAVRLDPELSAGCADADLLWR